MSPLTNRYFSVALTSSYINNFMLMFGLSPALSALYLGVANLLGVPASERQKTQEIVRNLHNSMTLTNATATDHAYISTALLGAHLLYSPYSPASSRKLSERLGLAWWTPLAPTDHDYFQSVQLQTILSAYVIDEIKLNATPTSPQLTVRERRLLRYEAAVRGFLRGLQKEGDIPSQIKFEHEQIEFELEICPFCGGVIG